MAVLKKACAMLNVILRIVTLNCWGISQPWPIGSKDRRYRIRKLAEALLSRSYDIIALQEVWSENDFIRIQGTIKEVYPFSYYFHSGFTGSGVCVFCRYPIVSTLMHRYSLNGFAHHIHRGDWFGGKVVGMVEIEIENYRVNFYTTHLHAEYNRKDDIYLPHRLTQAFELSQFVKHTSYTADAIILAGDFNLEPDDLGYCLIIKNANLNDAWLEKPNKCDSDGMTCERIDNCYTPGSVKRQGGCGKRLDYIMYKGGKSDVKLLFCENRFNQIEHNESINYSDHIGVYAEVEISNQHDKFRTQLLTPPNLLNNAIAITDEGEKRVRYDRRLFLSLCIALFTILVCSIRIEHIIPNLTFLVFTLRFLITLCIGFILWHGLIGLTIELKSLKAAKASMKMLLND